MSEKFHIPLAPLVNAATCAVVAVGVVVGVVLAVIGRAETINLMAMSLASAWLASVVAVVPLVWAAADPLNRLVAGLMLMLGTRMLLSVAGAGVLVAFDLPMEPVLAWVLVGYVVLLVVEVAMVVRHMPDDPTPGEPKADRDAANAHQHSSYSKEPAA